MPDSQLPPEEPDSIGEPESAGERIQLHDASANSDELAAFEPMDRPGWRVCGKVHNDYGEPLGGSVVEFQYREDNECFGIVAEATTGKDGCYAVCLPLPEKGCCWPFDSLVPSKLAATAHLPGYEPYSSSTDLPVPDAAGSEPVQVDLMLMGTVEVQGRVLFPDGNPVGSAEIYLCPRNGDSFIEVSHTWPDGRWGAWFCDEGINEFIAFKKNVGQSSPVTVVRDSDPVTIAPDMTLHPFGVLEGVLRDIYGRPIKGFIITALPESKVGFSYEGIMRFFEDQDRIDSEKPTISCRFETSLHGSAVSGTGGRFRISGLREGRYFFHISPGMKGQDEFLKPIPHHLYLTGSRTIELVQPYYRLKVRMRDQKGDPVYPATLWYRIWTPICGGYSLREETENGLVELMVIPGKVPMTGKGPEGLQAAKEITIHEGVYDTETDLILQPARPGRLAVRYQQANDPSSGNLARPEMILTGRLNKTFRADPDLVKREAPAFFSVEVPEDDYEIWVKPGGMASFFLPVLLKEWVSSGKESVVDVHLKPGGRVRMRLVPGIAPREWSTPVRGYIKRKNVDGYWRRYARLDFWERPASHNGRRVLEATDPMLYYDDFDTPSLRCSILEPGEYQLNISKRNWKHIRKEFRIEPGEETIVELRLEPVGV